MSGDSLQSPTINHIDIDVTQIYSSIPTHATNGPVTDFMKVAQRVALKRKSYVAVVRKSSRHLGLLHDDPVILNVPLIDPDFFPFFAFVFA
jgi:hypothetical protein